MLARAGMSFPGRSVITPRLSQLAPEFLVPPQLRLEPQLAAAERGHGPRRQHSLRGQPLALRGHRLQLPRYPAAPGREPLAQLRSVLTGGEQQHDRQRISGPEDDLQGRVPLDDQLQATLLGDLVHGPGRAAALLLFADRLDQAFTIELA